MALWWDSIGLVEQIFIIIAAPSTLILFIQMLMLIFAGGLDVPDPIDGGDSPGIDDGDGGFRLFSSNSILSFLTVFGWSGALLTETGIHVAIAGAFAFALGAAALVAMAFLIRALMKLAESGNINYRKALGKTARVYLTIPPAGHGQGKINMMIGETLGEFTAVTDGNSPIPTGAAVRVTDIAGNVFTVEKESVSQEQYTP